MCAAPRAPPPESTSPTRGRAAPACGGGAPAELGARAGDLVGAQRRAVRRRAARLLGRAVGDRGSAGDQARAIRGLGLGERAGDRFGIVAVDRAGVPARRREARELIVRH